MSILINILPTEKEDQAKEKTKRSLVLKLTIGVIVLVILITSATFGYKVYQGNQQENNNLEIAKATQQISLLKDQEGYLTLVKKRLNSINNLQTQQSQELIALNVMFNLLPNNISITSINSSRNGTVLISGVASDTTALQELIDVLSDPKINQQRLTKASIENLSRDTLGNFKFDVSTSVK